MFFFTHKSGFQTCLLVALLMMSALAGAEEKFFVRSWQSDEGLPDNTVVGIEQTPDGFLWVATQTGLVRFDGLQFRSFSTQVPELPGNMLHVVCTDREGRLWMVKEEGAVLCMEHGKVTVMLKPDPSHPSRRARMVVADHEGAIWVSFFGEGLVRIKDGKSRFYTAADGLPEGGTVLLVVDQGGQLWFLRSGKIGVFRGGRFVTLGEVPFEYMWAARAGGVWLSTDTALARYTEAGGLSEQAEWRAGDALPGVVVLLEDRLGRLWVGTRTGGLFCYAHQQLAPVNTQHKTIFCLREDSSSNIWAGTRGGGLKRISPKVVELLTTEGNTQFEGIQSLCKDTNGRLWGVPWPKGTVILDVDNGWSPQSVEDAGVIARPNSVSADPKGGIWVGTSNNGLYLWRDGKVVRHIGSTNGLAGKMITALKVTSSGVLWVGGRSSEKATYFLQSWEADTYQTFLLPASCGIVKALEVDSEGTCWAATSLGSLFRVSGTMLIDETRALLPEPHPIRTLLATPDKSLWIGFGGMGLGRLKDGQFSSCRSEHGLPDDYVTHILSDRQGRLWVAGNRGIFSFRSENWENVIAGRDTRLHSVVYTQKEGLPGLQASSDAHPGAFRDNEGRLLFAMHAGIAIVYPDAIPEEAGVPTVSIERVTANGKGVEPVEQGHAGATRDLPLGRRQVEFSFTAPQLTMPESIRFKYRLQGLDQEWMESGAHRSARYSQLAPGHYLFQVIACNRDGVWNRQGASFTMTVPPFWWETSWFRVGAPLAVAGMLMGLLVIALRQRHRRQLERLELQHATEEERARIARDMHDELGSYLTRIVMISESESESPAGSSETGAALKEINQAGREMTAKMSEIVWALNPAHDSLDSFAGYVAKRAHELLAAAKIHCRLDLPVDLPGSPLSSPVRHEVLLAFKEALHNILKHAQAKSVLITLRLEGASFVLSVKDDGKGFVVQPEAPAQGNGLTNMRHRLAEVGGCCEVVSQPGQGTCVRFIVPLETKQ